MHKKEDHKKHHVAHMEEMKGGEHSHMHHKKMAHHHHKEMKKHIDHLAKMAGGQKKARKTHEK